MRTTIALVAAIAVLLTGCAPGSARELKAQPGYESHAEVDVPYQRAYKNSLEKVRECIGEGAVGLFASHQIKSDIFTDLQEARISYVMLNLGQQNYYMQIDFKGLGANKTRIDAYGHSAGWRGLMDRVKVWAVDEGAPCDDKAKEAS